MSSTINFLGKDSGFGDNNNSGYIEIGNDLMIIDCGFAVFNNIKNRFDYNKYNNIYVVITHLHNDHAGSLSQFILYCWFIYHKKVIVVTKCDKMREFLEISGTVDEGYEITDNALGIKFIKTEHVAQMDAYGFKIDVNGRKLVYTGDTCTLDPYMPYVDDCDEFYVDTSKFGGVHLKFEDIIDKLKEIKANGTNVYLMHIDDFEYIKKLNNGEFYM
ncbi:MAG: MBL fold metallo-hydrolase [Clostridia bacterium]|nr:MBL fold metallo-hydrolase [Clostridia bacterium]